MLLFFPSFSRLHCDCDIEFHRCLKRANTFASVGVGIIFFNILQSRCFKEEYPIVRCIQLTGRTCEQYELDKSKKKIHQWFANPKFPISTETLFRETDAIKIGVGR
ncbi:phospholipase A2-like [Diaphorina citri]|uniref:phospholipase A2 n=1 Tax=Diaphorina citri TaxID=121845 RepID=A0A3Q0J2U8_DIACI|nr:phospholipase A2-like [Diaphorina citri]